MFSRGTDLLSRRFGATILRVSKTYNDDDVRAARALDWIQKSFSQLEQENEAAALAELKIFAQTINEVEAMRQAVIAAGIAPIPPDDWVDDMSSFSDARLDADKARLQNDAVSP